MLLALNTPPRRNRLVPGSRDVAASVIDQHKVSPIPSATLLWSDPLVKSRTIRWASHGILAKGDLHRPRGIIIDIQTFSNAMNIWGQMFYTVPVEGDRCE